MSDLRYPIGKFTPVPGLTAEQRAACIDQDAAAPGQFRKGVTGLTPAQLDTPYREGGWTVRQVAHLVNVQMMVLIATPIVFGRQESFERR